MRRYRVWPLFILFFKTKYILALFFRWGIKCEPKAIRKLESYLRENGSHSDFHLKSCGLHISITHPFIAASPDTLLICSCHGKIVIEVKCPFTHRNDHVLEAASTDKNFCLFVAEDGKLELEKNHQYYSQCQTQMLVCNTSLCYFVVYTEVDFVCLPVTLDTMLVESILSRSKLFVLEAVMPELI